MDTTQLNLLPGERLLWEGRPVRSTLFRPDDAVLIPFSIVFASVSLLPTALGVGALWHLRQPLAISFALAGLLFGSLSVYMLIYRFIVRAFTSRHTRYLVTNRRVVVLGGRSGTWRRSAFLASLPRPVFIEARDGSGSIAFGEFPWIWSWPRGAIPIGGRRRGIRLSAFSAESATSPVLWYVADVRRVGDLIAAAQRPASRPTDSPPRASAFVESVPRLSLGHGVYIHPGLMIIFVGAMIVLSAATGAAARYIPRFWWPQTSATVAECAPIVQKYNIVSTTRVLCTLVWTEGGTEHRRHMELPKGKHPEGSMLTVAVHGNTAQEPHVIVRVTLIAGFSFTAEVILLFCFVLWYRRMRRRARQREAAAQSGALSSGPAARPSN